MNAISTSVSHFFRKAILLVTLVLQIQLAFSNPSSAALPAGLIFRLRADKNEILLAEKSMKYFAPVHTDGNTSEMGMYSDFIKAQRERNRLMEMGFTNVNVIAYLDKKEIPTADAINHLNSNAATQSISVQKMDSLLSLVQQHDYYYAITIDFTDAKTVDVFFELGKTLQMVVNAAGKEMCIFGRFNSPEEAEVYIELLQQKGLKSVALSAWSKNNEALPLARILEISSSNPKELADQSR